MVKTKRPARTLILFMSVFVMVVIIISQYYFRQQNELVDPRVAAARKLYASYNKLAEEGRYDSIVHLLDSIDNMYARVGHYRYSFERGVINNNRGALWLTLGLQKEITDSTGQDSLVMLASDALQTAIVNYRHWYEKFGTTDKAGCRRIIADEFLSGMENHDREQQEKYLEKRVDEIMESTGEIERRLSVSYTNLGIVHRHFERYDSAAHYYTLALELWDRNLTAENNLNILLGLPKKKRNIIQQLFPPGR